MVVKSGAIFDDSLLEKLGETDDVVVDMSDTDYISSRGIRYLITAYRKLSEQNRKMTLTGANDSVREVLRISGLMKVLDVR